MAVVETQDSMEGCELCGLSLSKNRIENDHGDAFCCTGCRNIYAVLGGQSDIDDSDMRATGTDDETDSIDDDNPPDGYERTFLRVDGMHCATCETFIESIADANDEISNAEAMASSSLLVVTNSSRVLLDEPDLLHN